MTLEYNPSISVVCPTYNSELFIIDTIRSVMNQSHLPDELIIVDDGSKDQTVAIVRDLFEGVGSFQVSIISKDHRGPGAARNVGIHAAKSEWIAFLDSDDYWLPNKLLRMSKEITENPNSNFLCHNEILKGDGLHEQSLDYGSMCKSSYSIPEQLYARNFFSTSAVLCRRSLLIENNGFDETLMSAQDYELWLRLSPYIKVHFVSDVLGEYRFRPGNITSGKIWPRFKNNLRVLWRHKDKTDFSGFVLNFLRLLYSYYVKHLIPK